MIVASSRIAVIAAALAGGAACLAAADAHAVWVPDGRGVLVWRPVPAVGVVRRGPGPPIVVGGPPALGYAVPPRVAYSTPPQVGFGGPVTVTGPGRR